MPTSPMLSYHTGVYINCRDENGRAEMITWTEIASMTIPCFSEGYVKESSSHSFEYLLFDFHCIDIPVWLPTGIIEYVEVLDLYHVIRLVWYDFVLCLRVLSRSQEA